MEENICLCLCIVIKLLLIYCIYYLYLNTNLYQKTLIPIINKPTELKGGELISILTKWGETLDKINILQEYPRPQFVRNSYLNLNGEWEYSLKKGDETPEYNGKIIVPFSIESPLSGIYNKSLEPGMTLWYRRIIDLTKLENKGRFLLHFGAADQFTEVFINNKKVGEHDGGYTSFYFDITNYLNNDLSKTEIVVKVIDNFDKDGAAIGKQGQPRGLIFYIKTGGIWQTVWIESVPKEYIKDVKIIPNYDNNSVSFIMNVEGSKEKQNEGFIKIFDDKEKILINSSKITPNIEETIIISEKINSWSPENPYLYKLEYTYGEDKVKSYFGMRKFSIDIDKKGIKRLFLNNKPYFQKGVLDQGYWSDGYYTAPSDEALIYDIKTMKDLGFNMLRKHIKIEPKRWYYHCDTIGMIVWQDQPSGGKYPYNNADDALSIPDDDYEIYNRDNEIGRNNFIRDLKLTIEQLFNVPCISTWVPFNEGWGQFDSVKIANMVKDLDKTRFVDHASGWVDHLGPDFNSRHIYYEKIKIEPEKERPTVLSEYGGYGRIIENHLGAKILFSYLLFPGEKQLTISIKNLIKDEVFPNMKKGLCASVYTQLSDVEEEVNGFLTYDRKILKVDPYLIRRVNDLLKYKNE